MVIDRLNPMIQQVLNAYRRSPLGDACSAQGRRRGQESGGYFGGEASRHRADNQKRDIAYFVALDQACGQGLGYFRLGAEYEDERSFQQDLRIKPIYNRFAVYATRPAATRRPGHGVVLHYRAHGHVAL